MMHHRASLSLALIATYFIALPAIGGYVGFAHAGQFTYRIADYSLILLLFCIISLTGAVLFAGTARQDGGRWWAAVPLIVLLLLLAVFGPVYQSSAVSLLTTISLAPAVLFLLWVFPLRKGSLTWFGAVEAGFISVIGLFWAYGLFLVPPLPENIGVASPSLYDVAGTAYVYAGLPLLGFLILVLALQCRRDRLAGAHSRCFDRGESG